MANVACGKVGAKWKARGAVEMEWGSGDGGTMKPAGGWGALSPAPLTTPRSTDSAGTPQADEPTRMRSEGELTP